MSKEISVTRRDDGQIQVIKGTWSDTFPEDQRQPWIEWYEQMQKDHGYEGYGEMAQRLRDLG
ncbi:hypothetical protein TRM7557_03845 [Tritonibacter multivorans]|uniref:Uncharacterized protein n=1 Tax=Tritonibacter multivorans TaxID=928856 RepID=A0A0P1GJY4_9RHOB|nr:hypothetical protein [Tritonibacter multivorans]MDA7421508.1 hypothetical protein [Tritonibacter multivorans]CUH82276.1 hypothetical protein TRM7557_03845 [Tritonibacter multivorans]SFC97497.1 hypothetical protein SAMN04488049_105191 [Tritonibacter multivorans]